MKFLNKITSIASACFLTLALTGCSDYLDVSDEVAENRHSCISPWQYNHVIQRLWTL